MSNSFVTPWTTACQAPLTMEFSRQEYSSGLPFPSPKTDEGGVLHLSPDTRVCVCVYAHIHVSSYLYLNKLIKIINQVTIKYQI